MKPITEFLVNNHVKPSGISIEDIDDEMYLHVEDKTGEDVTIIHTNYINARRSTYVTVHYTSSIHFENAIDNPEYGVVTVGYFKDIKRDKYIMPASDEEKQILDKIEDYVNNHKNDFGSGQLYSGFALGTYNNGKIQYDKK